MAFHKAKALQEAEKSVSQGKISQAIRQYQEILSNDPADVSLFNTIGDLYIRDRNITEGLKQFHKLAEAYTRDGFNVKAIAIYRKISKVDSTSVDTLLKLAELYQLQGLSREAREQYLQAIEYFKKRNQTDRALEVLRKLVQLDPENVNFRARLAMECEQAGKREDAAHAHLGVAEILLRRNDQAAAEVSLKKAAELDPRNSKIQILRARVAMARQQPDEAERIIKSLPELQSDPVGKRILLDAYLGSRKLPEARSLVLEVFNSNPTDFIPVFSLAGLLVDEGEIEDSYQLLSSVADGAISQSNAAPLLDALRRIWGKAPRHIPTLELIHRICERTADELTLPQVLEALGQAHEEGGDLEKAEAAYLKLVEREPENEDYRGLLDAIQQKLGREIRPADFASREMALVAEEEEQTPEPEAIDAKQAAMVKEALENSDLFTRYNLPEKAIAELEKVLQIYPDQIDIHRRILEISRKGFPERGAVAAAHLARIFTERGDQDTASNYQAIASAKGPLHELPLPAAPPSPRVEEPPPPTAPPQAAKPSVTSEFPIPMINPEEPVATAEVVTSEPASFDLTPPEAPIEQSAVPPPPIPPAPAAATMELDLSGDFEAFSAFGLQGTPLPAPEPALPPPAPLDILAPAGETPAPPEEASPPPAVAEEPASVAEIPEEAPVETPPQVPAEVASEPPPPIELIIEMPVEPAVESPVEIVAEVPAEPTVEAPVVVAEEPAEPTVEAPVELVAEAPTEPTVEGPVETVAVTPAEPILDTHVETAAETPAETPAELVVETPAEPEVVGTAEPSQEVAEPLPAPVEEAAPPEFEDSRVEVEFYLENGFIDEARQAVSVLEEKYPGRSFVAALRRRLNERADAMPVPPAPTPPAEEAVAAEAPEEFDITEETAAIEPPAIPVPIEESPVAEPPPAEFELTDEILAAGPPSTLAPAEEAAVAEPPMEAVGPPPETAHLPEPVPLEEEPAHEEWELPTSYAATPQPTVDAVAPPPAIEPAPSAPLAVGPTPQPVAPGPPTAEGGGMDLLGDLAGDLASTFDGLAASADTPAPARPKPTAAAPPTVPSQGAEQLSGLLAEMEDPGGVAAARSDPETHYNLGVAFREMGLLDESIGEFQKVVKGAGKGNYPHNFLQACSLLAICFMEKKMPAIAVKWYLRALETPGLDEEALMALQYDLGIAYEQAGDSHNALERFIEVYSQNIDFRDVAEKIRELQQKA